MIQRADYLERLSSNAQTLRKDMTEEQIERIAESRMDSLDSRLMSGKLSQSEYDAETRKLNRWCEDQYKQIRRV